jgi:hypothetical protein
MIEQLNISKCLKAQYFWDVDIQKLDLNRSKRMIIERIFVMGTSSEIMQVINYYSILSRNFFIFHCNLLNATHKNS